MKTIIINILPVVLVALLSGCATGPSAQTGTAVGAVAGAVVAGPVGAVAGGAVGNAYGGETDRRR
jgi:osmotically inducible lipoprotein OsmB